MEGESGEQVGDELRECDIISRVIYARLTEWGIQGGVCSNWLQRYEKHRFTFETRTI